MMATWRPWWAAPPAMPCEARQDVDTDGSSRLIYYLIKGSRHRWWTASGRAGAWGREVGGRGTGGQTRPPPGLQGRTHGGIWTFPSPANNLPSPLPAEPAGQREIQLLHGGAPRATLSWCHTPKACTPLAVKHVSPGPRNTPSWGPSLPSPLPPNYCRSPSPTPPLGQELRLSMMQIWACFSFAPKRSGPGTAPATAQLAPAMATPWPQDSPFPTPTSPLGYRGHLPGSKCIMPLGRCKCYSL